MNFNQDIIPIFLEKIFVGIKILDDVPITIQPKANEVRHRDKEIPC